MCGTWNYIAAAVAERATGAIIIFDVAVLFHANRRQTRGIVYTEASWVYVLFRAHVVGVSDARRRRVHGRARNVASVNSRESCMQNELLVFRSQKC